MTIIIIIIIMILVILQYPSLHLLAPPPPSQVLLLSVSPVRRSRKTFFIIGNNDFSSLDNRILQRVEIISKISQDHPFRYKQEIFTDLNELIAYADAVADNEVVELVRMSKRWGSNIRSIRETIKYHYAVSEETADVVLVTIHKAKGLEWKRVALGSPILLLA